MNIKIRQSTQFDSLNQLFKPGHFVLWVMALLLALPFSVMAETVKGRIEYISNKASTIQIAVKGKPSAVVRFDKNTQFENTENIKALSPPDLIKVEFEPGKPASKITKIVFGLPAGVEIDIKELLEILQNKQGPYMLGDARPTKKYLMGHVPSSVSTPVADPEKLLAKLPADKNKLLVFYCGGPTCPFTKQAYDIATKAGYTNVKGFQKGIPGWKKNKLPVHSNRGWVSKNLDKHHVVIDVRDAATAGNEHLSSAVNLPATQIAAMTKNFMKTQKLARLPGVTDTRAPIILYSDTHSARDVLVAFKELRSWGYKNVTILEGGLKAWKADGLPTESEKLAKTIHFEKKLAKGAIPPDEFFALVKNPENVVFLDVRTEAEVVKHGALKDALQIPLDQLEDKLATLPKDKEIIVYCENGIRAEMAMGTLKDKGFKSRFLNETTEFDGKGNMSI
jgi:rhodanese-related sulfurtransferase